MGFFWLSLAGMFFVEFFRSNLETEKSILPVIIVETLVVGMAILSARALFRTRFRLEPDSLKEFDHRGKLVANIELDNSTEISVVRDPNAKGRRICVLRRHQLEVYVPDHLNRWNELVDEIRKRLSTYSSVH